jgi:hypothetical protein
LGRERTSALDLGGVTMPETSSEVADLKLAISSSMAVIGGRHTTHEAK